jgi:hypothetical protein
VDSVVIALLPMVKAVPSLSCSMELFWCHSVVTSYVLAPGVQEWHMVQHIAADQYSLIIEVVIAGLFGLRLQLSCWADGALVPLASILKTGQVCLDAVETKRLQRRQDNVL